jgi:hypothetical protein
MVSSCVEFFTTDSSDACALDSMMLLINGDGGWFGYLLWAILLVLGIVRWIFGIECSIYAVVDDVVLADQSVKEDLNAPLLDQGGLNGAHRPLDKPPSESGKGRRPPPPPPIGPPS